MIPQDTALTERPDLFPAWDSLNADQKKLYVRQMEVYAGYQENADWNVGRLLDAIDDMGDLDNTLIFYIWGDNGASMEGTITGSFNEMTFLNGVVLEPDAATEADRPVRRHRRLGGEHSAPHFAAAWAHAGNTPFQWGKQMASHLGGTRNPMVVSWPDRIKPDRDVRTQFTHCIDIGPTVLEAAGHPRAEDCRWDRAGADGRHQLPATPSTMLTPRSGTPCSTSSSPAPGPSTRTAGGRARSWTGIPWDLSPETMKRFAPGRL